MSPEAAVAGAFGKNISAINDATSPDTLPEWDSLGHITLVIELESIYGVSFSAEETMALTSVGAIKNVIRSHGVVW